jgi:isoleucyl-tRNA synthetase
MSGRLLSAAELSASLRLPKTSFPMRANAAQREVGAVDRLTTQLYRRQVAVDDGEPGGSPRPPFVLHDGPPYANGPLHMGHALNKVLKDIVNRHRLQRGARVVFVPGWDCHGLPIELKALEALGDAGRRSTTPTHLRASAKAWALNAVAGQKKDFVRWGIMADWSEDGSGVYTTMAPAYEAAQLGAWPLGRLRLAPHTRMWVCNRT